MQRIKVKVERVTKKSFLKFMGDARW